MKLLPSRGLFIVGRLSGLAIAVFSMVALFVATVGEAQAAPPRITSVFSPGGTVQMKVGTTQSSFRQAVPLPESPFTLTTGAGDLLQVQLAGGAWVRLAPNSSVSFDPSANTFQLVSGSVLAFYPLDGGLREVGMNAQGRNSLVLLTRDPAGTRIMSLRGIVDFRGQPLSEGHIAIAVGAAGVRDIGPTDMDRFQNESAMLVDLPGSPSLSTMLHPSSTGLRGTLDSVNATRRHEAAQERYQGSVKTFFGEGVAQLEGARATISQNLPAASLNPGMPVNPGREIQQFQQQALLSRPPPPPAPPAPPIPPAPPPVIGVPTIFNTDWAISPGGVITANGGALTLNPYFNSGGVAAYTVDTMTVNSHLSLAGAGAFAAAGGKELNFTSSGNVGGNGFVFNASIDLGPLSLTLNSTASVVLGNVTTTGANGAVGTAGGAGGNVNVRSSSGDITLTGTVSSFGGKGGAAAGATIAGAGGAGGAITLTSSAGKVAGGGNLLSVAGDGGNANAGETAGAGGAGGTVTVRTGGAGGTTVGFVASGGGNAGTLSGTGNTASGGAGGTVTIEGASAGSQASGPVAAGVVLSSGGSSDTGGAVKTSVGDGGNGGTITIRTAGNLSATTVIQSQGGDSAAHTDHTQKVPVAGAGGVVSITSGSVSDGTTIVSMGGNGGATDGSLPAPFGLSAPSTTQKAGNGGAGGAVSVTVTGAGAYAPQVLSIGGDAGNTQTSAEAGGAFSRVFNGVGGKGGDLTITQTNPAGTLNMLAAGGATLGSRGGNEVISGSVQAYVGGVPVGPATDMGGSTTSGRNVNGSVTIDVGTTRDLHISSSTAVSSAGNGTAAGYDRDANGGLGQFIPQASGNVTVTSKNLTIDGGGAIAAGGSAVIINSTGNVVVDATPTGPGDLSAGIQSTGGTSMEKATAVQLKGGTSTTPAIYNTAGGDVKIDVSKGTGGIIDLKSNSILSTSSAKNTVTGLRTSGNVTLTGSGLTQADGELYGISAESLAVIATGTITVNKSGIPGSAADVGSAGRQGDPSLSGTPAGTTTSPALQTPSYTIPAQGGNAKITSTPLVILSSQTAVTVVDPVTHIPTSTPLVPTPTPFDDAQHGTAQLTSSASTQPFLVGTDTPPPAGVTALHNFDNATPGTVAQFITIKEVTRTGISVPPTIPTGTKTVIVSDPTKVIVNK